MKEELFEKMLLQGITEDDAFAYAVWLKTRKVSTKSSVQLAYLSEKAKTLSASSFNPSRLGDIWGVSVGDVFWCRLHTDWWKLEDLKLFHDGRIVVSDELRTKKASSYEIIRWEYFFTGAGSNKLTYWIPSVEHFRKMLPHLNEVSVQMNFLRDQGHCAEDWLNTDYWAFDVKHKKLVVFDIKNGKAKAADENESYPLRPVWLPHGYEK